MKLSPEQIAEILSTHDKIKPNAVGTYTPTKYPPPKQVGPVRFLRDGPAEKCMHELNERFCLTPTHIKFQGKYHCLLHAVMACNELLVIKGVLE